MGKLPYRVTVFIVLLGTLYKVRGGETPQVVAFQASDGMRLTADYFPPPDDLRTPAPMVILLHMYRSDRRAWQPLIRPLHEAGFAVLAVDLRGHGESATTETRQRVLERDPKLFREMQNDLRGAYDFLAGQPRVDRARFALVGASIGCSVALQYAAQDRSVDAVVCLSPGLDYLGLDSGGDIAQITGRQLLLIATEDEKDVVYTLQKRGSGVQVQIPAGTPAHGTDMLGVVDRIERDVVAFLKSAVGEPSAALVCGSINRDVYHEPDSAWVQQIAPSNLRYYSSAAEAEARGLRPAKSKGPARTGGEQRDSGRRRSGRP